MGKDKNHENSEIDQPVVPETSAVPSEKWGMGLFESSLVRGAIEFGKWAIRPVTDRIARSRATQAIFRGNDLSHLFGLRPLVQEGLRSLAARKEGALPAGLQIVPFRRWLLDPTNEPLFVEAAIAFAAASDSAFAHSERLLNQKYESETQNFHTPIVQQVRWVISIVHARIEATKKGRNALAYALTKWSAGQQYATANDETNRLPSALEIERAKSAALEFTRAGALLWKMPAFAAPLAIEIQDRSEPNISGSLSSSDLVELVREGMNLVLFGEGGVGKTTLMLMLAEACLAQWNRQPIFIDAPTWAQSGDSILGFVASRLPSTKFNLDEKVLSRLAVSGRIAIFINGWNEMAAQSKASCRSELHQLSISAPAMSIVVSTRSPADSPGLSISRSVAVLGLTWEGQRAIIGAELGQSGGELLRLLGTNNPLRHSARSPLILRGMIARARKGSLNRVSDFELIGAAIETFEEAEQRRDVLTGALLEGRHGSYLEEIACSLTEAAATRCSREDATRCIRRAAQRLASDELIAAVPVSLTAVLDTLLAHHLLHEVDGKVRFAHQRFQEYFAAARILANAALPTADRFLRTALNLESWADACYLAISQLIQTSQTRSVLRLVRTATELDLGLACHIAGLCGLERKDDSQLHDTLVERVGALGASPLQEVRELSTSYKIVSRLAAFANDIWKVLEDDGQQTRLRSHYASGTRVRLDQLGAGAASRIAKWPEDRRAEFAHECAANPDNFDFMVDLAQTDPSNKVRAAAITGLFFYFPASDARLQTWLTAPIEVQTDRDVLSLVFHELQRGGVDSSIRTRLDAIRSGEMADDIQVELALASDSVPSLPAINAMVGRLRRSKHSNWRDDRLIDFLGKHSKVQLHDLAVELAFESRDPPDWIKAALKQAGRPIRRRQFELAWSQLLGTEFKAISGEVFGPLADYPQIERCIDFRLESARDRQRYLDKTDRERSDKIGEILASVDGERLLKLVLNRSSSANYLDSTELLRTLLRRIGREGTSSEPEIPWLPTADECAALISAYADKKEDVESIQEEVRILLARIASHVAPSRFSEFILGCCEKYLDAWTRYNQAVAEKGQKARQQLASPSYGSYMAAAVARCGPSVLPELLNLLEHPSWVHFVPEAIIRVCSAPWSAKQDALSNGMIGHIRAGEMRRALGLVLKQPDECLQANTDAAARELGDKLFKAVAEGRRTIEAHPEKARTVEYGTKALAEVVSRIPSTLTLAPVLSAIESGIFGFGSTLSIMGGLTRQGFEFSEAKHTNRLEVLLEDTCAKSWFEQWEQHCIGEACLLLATLPDSARSGSITHFLERWRKVAPYTEIVRSLGATHALSAWLALMEAANLSDSEAGKLEVFVDAVVTVLAKPRIQEFFRLIADNSLQKRLRSVWYAARIAEQIADNLRDSEDDIRDFIVACQESASAMGDALAVEVLSRIEDREEMAAKYLLNSLDAGRGMDGESSTFQQILKMFEKRIPISQAQFQIAQRSNNYLREQLYARAGGIGNLGKSCRRLLAALEQERLEKGRPSEEFHHPAEADNRDWTLTLIAAGVENGELPRKR
jgi:hypothetical protein